jgi:Chaperone of endosialidase
MRNILSRPLPRLRTFAPLCVGLGLLLTPQISVADQVIPDDLIVQGSICTGFDCVNNESFGFDTIRLKENNTRIKFEDTSLAPFPTTDWQLTANDSASGGANKFSIEDTTSARVPFTITGGAPTNAIFVDSTGRVGLRTATPVLDLHINTSNTPAMRLEQNNSGGFTAQTWDIGANEANFFVRDVTGGSRLSFRIRPGAPTSSIDISASGDVGIGTGSPTEKLHISENVDGNTLMLVQNPNVGTSAVAVVRALSDVATVNFQAHANARTVTRFGQALGGWAEMLLVAGNGLAIGTTSNTSVILGANNTKRVEITGTGVTVFGTFTNSSSRDYKDHITTLSTEEAMSALAGLQPVKFRYKEQTEENVGFIAEDVPDLVAVEGRKSIAPMDMIALLTKVVQEQQKMITRLDATVAKLEQQR